MFKTEEEINEEFEQLLHILPDDKYGKLVRIAAEKGMTPAQKEFFLDRSKNSDQIVHRIKNLNSTFYENCFQINNDQANNSNYKMFFIDLWIYLDELSIYFEKSSNNQENFGKIIENANEYLQITKEVRASLIDLKQALDEDQILAIEYLRINFSHLQSSKYVIQFNPSNGFSREINGNYRPEIRKRIKDALDNYHSDYSLFAKALTTIIEKPISQVYKKINEWVSFNFKS